MCANHSITSLTIVDESVSFLVVCCCYCTVLEHRIVLLQHRNDLAGVAAVGDCIHLGRRVLRDEDRCCNLRCNSAAMMKLVHGMHLDPGPVGLTVV